MSKSNINDDCKNEARESFKQNYFDAEFHLYGPTFVWFDKKSSITDKGSYNLNHFEFKENLMRENLIAKMLY